MHNKESGGRATEMEADRKKWRRGKTKNEIILSSNGIQISTHHRDLQRISPGETDANIKAV